MPAHHCLHSVSHVPNKFKQSNSLVFAITIESNRIELSRVDSMLLALSKCAVPRHHGRFIGSLLVLSVET